MFSKIFGFINKSYTFIKDKIVCKRWFKIFINVLMIVSLVLSGLQPFGYILWIILITKIYKFFRWLFRFNGLPKTTDHLTVVCGKRGAGKTTVLAALAYTFFSEREKLRNNPKVMEIYNNPELSDIEKFRLTRSFTRKFYFKNTTPDSEAYSNFEIKGCNFLEFQDMGLHDFGIGALFLFDEMASSSSGINNRNWQNNFKNSKGELALDRLLYERHYLSNGVFVVSQSPQSLDSNIENLQPPVWYCKRNRNILRCFRGIRITTFDYQLALVSDKNKKTGAKSQQQAFGLTVSPLSPISPRGRGWILGKNYWHMFDSWFHPDLPKAPKISFEDYLKVRTEKALQILSNVSWEERQEVVKIASERKKIIDSEIKLKDFISPKIDEELPQ